MDLGLVILINLVILIKVEFIVRVIEEGTLEIRMGLAFLTLIQVESIQESIQKAFLRPISSTLGYQLMFEVEDFIEPFIGAQDYSRSCF